MIGTGKSQAPLRSSRDGSVITTPSLQGCPTEDGGETLFQPDVEAQTYQPLTGKTVLKRATQGQSRFRSLHRPHFYRRYHYEYLSRIGATLSSLKPSSMANDRNGLSSTLPGEVPLGQRLAAFRSR